MRDDERRLKIVFVPERELLHLFQPIGQCVALRLDHPRLPADAKVVRVHHQYDRMALAVVVHSASFPVCPAGQQLEYFETSDWSPRFEARYVVGDRLTPFKPMEVAIQEQAERQAINNAIGPLYISPALKAKLEACTEIVDHKPLSESADVARRVCIANLLDRFKRGEKIKWGEVTAAIGYLPEQTVGSTVPITINGKVVGSAKLGAEGTAEMWIGKQTAAELERVLHPPVMLYAGDDIGGGTMLPAESPRLDFALLNTSVIPSALLEGESTMSGDKEAELEFFKKSILAD